MCPLCHSNKVRRSRPRTRDFLFLILQARPMRCRACCYRFYRWPWSNWGKRGSGNAAGKRVHWRPARTASQQPIQLTAFKPLKRSASAGSGKP
jgi:hypothetical protein